MRLLIACFAVVMLLASCKEKKEDVFDKESSPELIQEIKKNDSSAVAIDSLNNEIKEASDKLDELLKDLN